jgi:hypothetical protein
MEFVIHGIVREDAKCIGVFSKHTCIIHGFHEGGGIL